MQPQDVQFAELVEQLAVTCDSIVAVPATIDISPPYAVRYGGIGIVTKTDRCLLVGAEKISADSDPTGQERPSCELGHVYYRVPEFDRYECLSPARRNRLNRGLPGVLKREELNQKVCLHILSELPFYRGMNLDATIAVGIAMVLLLANGVFSIKELERITTIPLSLGRSDADYKRIFKLAWKIEVLISKYRPEGHHLHAALSGLSACTIFWRDSTNAPEAIEPLLTEDPFTLKPDGGALHELAQRTQQPVAELDDGPEPSSAEPEDATIFTVDPLAAVDIAAVFVGREVDSEDAYAAHRHEYRRRIDEYAHAVKERLRDRHGSASGARFWAMLEESTSADGKALRVSRNSTAAADRMMDLLVVKSLETFALITELAKDGVTRSSLRNLVMSVDQSQDMYRLLDLSSGLIDEACHSLRAELRDLTRQKVGVRLMGAGRGGCLLVMAAKGSLAAALPVALERIRVQLSLPAWLPSVHWASFNRTATPYLPTNRSESYEYVRQHLPKKRYAFATNKTLLVREWRDGAALPLRLYDADAWSRYNPEFDLVIDFAARQGDPVSVLHRGKIIEPSSPQKPTPSDSKKGNPVMAPQRAAEILDWLLSQAQTGATRVSLGAEALKAKYKVKSYDKSLYVGTLLWHATEQELFERYGIAIKELGTKPKEDGGYELVAAPPTDARIAVVWRWPRTASADLG